MLQKVSVIATMALCYLVTTMTVITFELGHLNFFLALMGPKIVEPKSLILSRQARGSI